MGKRGRRKSAEKWRAEETAEAGKKGKTGVKQAEKMKGRDSGHYSEQLVPHEGRPSISH